MSIEFDLINIDNGRVVFSSANVAEVNKHAAELKAAGLKVRLQKRTAALDDSVWHEREQKKFDSGAYKPIPDLWRKAKWFASSKETAYHFPHIATDGESVAYTPSSEWGHADRRTSLSPARYLAKFYGHILRPEEISRFANAFTDDRFVLEFLSEPKDFSWAYQQHYMKNPSSGADSCMGYAPSHFGLKRHPAEAYACDDLAIAVIRDPNNRDKILARSIVWPKGKAANRCYGTEEKMRDILLNKLNLAGYEQSNSFAGAKIAAISINEVNGRSLRAMERGYQSYLMPYIDGDCSAVRWGPGNDHFVLVSRARSRDNVTVCQTTCGYIQMPRPLLAGEFYCERCHDVSTEPNNVFVNEGRPDRPARKWCSRCTTEHSFKCEITNTHRSGFPSDEVMVSSNPMRRVRGWIDSEFVAECYRTGEFFDVRVFGPLVPVTTAEGEHIRICSAFRKETDVDYVQPEKKKKKPATTDLWMALDEPDDFALRPLDVNQANARIAVRREPR